MDCDQLFEVLDPVIGERHHPVFTDADMATPPDMIPLLVDPKIPHIDYYAGVTLLTPNNAEAEAAAAEALAAREAAEHAASEQVDLAARAAAERRTAEMRHQEVVEEATAAATEHAEAIRTYHADEHAKAAKLLFDAVEPLLRGDVRYTASAEEAQVADSEADYIGVGPIWETPSKADADPAIPRY